VIHNNFADRMRFARRHNVRVSALSVLEDKVLAYLDFHG